MVRRGLIGERLIGLFLFGLLLFMPPLISVFDKVRLVAGVPLLYGYLFLVWALVIVLMAATVERSTGEDDQADGDSAPGRDSERGRGVGSGL